MRPVWIRVLIGLALVAAAITIGVILAPYIIGGIILWCAWKWVVGPTISLPRNGPGRTIDVSPTARYRSYDRGRK